MRRTQHNGIGISMIILRHLLVETRSEFRLRRRSLHGNFVQVKADGCHIYSFDAACATRFNTAEMEMAPGIRGGVFAWNNLSQVFLRSWISGGDTNRMYKTHGLALDSWTVDYRIGTVGIPCDESCVQMDMYYYDVAWDIAVPTHPLCDFLVESLRLL